MVPLVPAIFRLYSILSWFVWSDSPNIRITITETIAKLVSFFTNDEPMRVNVKSKPIILSVSTDIILKEAVTANSFLDRFGIFEISNNEKNVRVSANMSLWRSHEVLSTASWNITKNDKKILCRLSRRNKCLPIEKMASEKNPKTSTIEPEMTILGSAWNTCDITYSNDM